MLGTHCVATRVGDGAYRIVRVAAAPPAVARTISAPPASVTPTTLDEVVVTASRTDNLLHLRCELPHPTTASLFEALMGTPELAR